MTCLSCGADNPPESLFCIRCGTPMPNAQAGMGLPAEAGDAPATPWSPGPAYAGFWLRFLAYFIDSVIVTIAYYLLIIPLGIVFGVSGMFSLESEEPTGTELVFMVVSMGLSIGISWLYEAVLTSSERQATFGKSAIGLIVTDVGGARISFLRATGRYFAKIPSAMILMIGYLMQPFTSKKQALHDILAGTLVVKK